MGYWLAHLTFVEREVFWMFVWLTITAAIILALAAWNERRR